MEVRVLGPVEFNAGLRWTRPGRRQERCLLAVLALAAPRPLATERLMELVWAGHPPARARDALYTYVSRLRAALTAAGGLPGVLRREPAGYLLNVDPLMVDAARFDALLRRAQAEPCPCSRSDLLRQALAMWRGPALADVGSALVRERLAARLERQRMLAAELRIEADLAAGRHQDLLGELAELVARDPLAEHLTGQLMLALHRAGHRQEGMAAFGALRERLRAELGLSPGSKVSELYAAILRDDPSLRVS